jgi:hypothetical protein
MNKQILENRLIDSVALVIMQEINLLVKYLFRNISSFKEIKKSLTLLSFMNWHSNQKNYLPQTGHKK